MRRILFAFILAALAFASATNVAHSANRLVPSQFTELDPAIQASSAGDTVTVTSPGTGYLPFTLDRNVLVRSTSSQQVTITATTSYAAQITIGTGTIDGGTYGFKFIGAAGAPGVVRVFSGIVTNCTIADNGNAYANSAVRIDGGGKLTNCIVTLSSTTSAHAVLIDVYSNGEVSGCTITSAKSTLSGNYELIRALGISGAKILNNTIEFSDSTTDGQAISSTSPSATIDLRNGTTHLSEVEVTGTSSILPEDHFVSPVFC